MSPEPAGWKACATQRRHSCPRVRATFQSPGPHPLLTTPAITYIDLVSPLGRTKNIGQLIDPDDLAAVQRRQHTDSRDERGTPDHCRMIMARIKQTRSRHRVAVGRSPNGDR